MAVPNIKLNTGASMPAIGLGAWSGRTAEEHASCAPWVLHALKAGYRHIDTAWGYGTEKYVGDAIRKSGIPREDIFVTTKLPCHHPGRVEQSINDSLKSAGLDYFDLYLIHFPQVFIYEDDHPTAHSPSQVVEVTDKPSVNDTWAEMEAVFASGKVKAIGVSNFSIKTLDQVLKTAKVIPAVNQVEMHPYLAQHDLVAYCKAKGIVITAYTPSGKDPVRGDPTIIELAKKYNATPTQIILSWHVGRGTTAVPRSTNEERQKENLKLIKLDSADAARVDGLDRNERITNKAGADGKMYGWTYEQLGW